MVAPSPLRIRRAIVALSSSPLQRPRPFSAAATSPVRTTPIPFLVPLSQSLLRGVAASPSLLLRPTHYCCRLQFLASFRTSPLSLDRRSGGDDGKISPDEILFEGCDYNHWLITMDFPKDPKPTPEEMVETYVQTLAKVVGSVEEAKKRMYACSTTTYTGFQAVMTEEMSEKFRGLPGVVFILPDSYIDPVNKEYGGDKYENGVITPRPPPVQYGRQGRYGDRNRNYDRPRYDRQREPMPMQQGNPPYDRQGPMQGDGRNYAPQQNYNQAGQDRRGYGPPGGAPPMDRREFGQGERRDYAQGGGGYNAPGGGGGYQGERRDYAQGGGGYNAPGGGGGYQGERRDPMHSYQRDFSQGGQGSFASQDHRDFSQGQQVSGGSDYGQGVTSGYGGDWRQGPGSYGQNTSGTAEGQRYREMEYKNNPQGEQTNYSPPRTNQG